MAEVVGNLTHIGPCQFKLTLTVSTHFIHTSTPESFHNMRLFFPSTSMRMRMQLAVIDHNVNTDRTNHTVKQIVAVVQVNKHPKTLQILKSYIYL